MFKLSEIHWCKSLRKLQNAWGRTRVSSIRPRKPIKLKIKLEKTEKSETNDPYSHHKQGHLTLPLMSLLITTLKFRFNSSTVCNFNINWVNVEIHNQNVTKPKLTVEKIHVLYRKLENFLIILKMIYSRFSENRLRKQNRKKKLSAIETALLNLIK